MIRSELPAEGLLRPIGEWHVVMTCFVAAVLSILAYEYLFMSKTLAYVSGGFFLYMSFLYARDGWHLKVYQRNIKRLRHYEIEPKDIPYSSNYVLLGKGFRWLPIHTQRLRDTGKVVNKEYIVDSELFTKVREFCLKNADVKEFAWLVRLLNKNSPWNPFRPLPDIGGNPAIHGIEPHEVDHLWRLGEREGHTGILGTTGVGKTRLAELIIAADIRAGAKKITKHVVDIWLPTNVFRVSFVALFLAVVSHFSGGYYNVWPTGGFVAKYLVSFPVVGQMALSLLCWFLGYFSLGMMAVKLRFSLGTTMLSDDGNVVVVLDPKGDGELLRRCVAECIRTGRLDDFYMFHLGFPGQSCEYNPVGDYQQITEVAGRSTNQLAAEGNSAVFKEFSWRFVNMVAQAMERVGEEPSYERISNYVSNPELILKKYLDKMFAESDPDWMQTVHEMAAGIDDKAASFAGRAKDVMALTLKAKSELENKEDPIIRGLVNSLEYSKTYYDKIVASLLPFLDKMTTGPARDLLCPGLIPKKGRRRLRWRDAISRRAVVYVGLDALTNPVTAVATASAMLSDLCSVTGEIYKHGSNFDEPTFKKRKKPVPIVLHLDEFNELITGDEIIQILNKARGAGVMCHVYSQTIKDVEAKIGSAAKAGQIIGNLQNLIMMRVRDDETAELLVNQLPEIEVMSNTEVSGTSDSGALYDFSTSNADRSTTKSEAMLHISDITTLPKGQAFIYKNGGELHKIRIPIILADDIELPSAVEEMAVVMKQKYQTSDNWGDRLNG